MALYLAYFDTAGFEYLCNITEEESKCVMSTLKGERYCLPFNLNALLMRARFNPHRSPEIWTFNVDDDLSHDSVEDLARKKPQFLADFIRANGKNIFGRDPGRKQVIR